VLKSRSSDRVEVEINGNDMVFETLAKIEFSSVRRKMTVITRLLDDKTKDGRDPDPVLVYTKGADSSIYERLSSNSPEEIGFAT
jgi:magnesium-transporting ATPase (P-type)